MTALKDEPFLEVMSRSYKKTRAGDYKCQIPLITHVCGKEFPTLEEYIYHLRREHMNDELPKRRGEN